MSLVDGSQYSSLVSLPPKVSISPKAVELTGINDALCAAEGRPILDVLGGFHDFVRRQVEAAGPGAYPLLIAHNLKSAPWGGGQQGHTAGSEPGLAGCTQVPGEMSESVLCASLSASSSADFDAPFIKRFANQSGLPQLRHARFLDSLLLARAVLPAPRDLGALYKQFTGREFDAHRAMADCLALREVLVHLLAKHPPPGLDSLPGVWGHGDTALRS